MSSQGNGLISRSIIYQVSELLKTTPSENILVGVMWSGPTRHEIFNSENFNFSQNFDGWIENPTKFILSNAKNWIILNYHWTNNISQTYYKKIHSTVGSYIISFEHILRLQWFLKLHKIKFFMSTYTSEVFSKDMITNEDAKHLYDQIDFSYFLPIEGEYEWCRDYSGLDFPNLDDNHPGEEQHQQFTNLVIVPFLKNRSYI